MTEKLYLAAGFTFLNRDTQEEKAIAYPVTRIELYKRMHEGNPRGAPTRVFVISDDGEEWQEVS